MSLNDWNFSSHAIPSLPLLCSQLHEASYSRRDDVIRFLLSRIPQQYLQQVLSSTEPTTSNTPLLWACITGCLSVISLLVEYGSNLKVQNLEGKTALHLAVSSGSVESAAYLMEKLWSLANVGDLDGATPLHYASVAFPQMVQLFKAARCSFRVYDHDGDTPTHWAVRDSCVDNVREMFTYDQGIRDIPNAYEQTPLHLSETFEEKEIFQIFTGSEYKAKALGAQMELLVVTDKLNLNQPKADVRLPVKTSTPGQNVWGLACSHVAFSV